MYVKAEIILETKSDDSINAIEDLIHTILVDGESISDYAFIYTRRNEKENWKEVK